MQGENTPAGAEYTVTLEFSNSRSMPLAFVLEPWGRVHELPPGVELHLTGPVGVSQVETGDDAIIVYAWSGCTVALFHDGVRLGPEGGPPVPDLPAGMGMKRFIDMMLRGREPEGNDQC